MRLLRLEDDGELSLVEFSGKNIPHYAILSHTWGTDDGEVTFKDLEDGSGKSKTGYSKIRFCGKQAAGDGLQFFWVDTCCIDKSSSAELSEAINSMFRWYQNSARCYVYLSDVSVSDSEDEFSRRWKPAFKKCKWFTRGWTLQELIAPASVEFFSKEEQRLGDKQSLEQTLHEITGIAIQALRGSPLSHFSMNERMSWAAKRDTKHEEDAAYSLLGIFDIYMPLIYGEGRKNALARLQKEIEESEKPKWMLLDSLRFDQIDARQLTIKNAHAKTCKWLLKTSEYLDWLNATKLATHHGFLWINGKPGTGKSTLMKFVLANARKTMKDRIVISFFFNARGEGLEKSTIGTYQSLLLQLLEQLPALQRVFDSLRLSKPSISTYHQWSVELLKTLLEEAIQLLGGSSVLCFIDALDECEESQIRDMVSFFEHVGELAVSAGIQFHVCFSSRHYPHITIRKGLSLVLEGQEGHNQDITNYLNSELKIGQSKVAQQIRTEVQEKASGIFMWVVLVVGILNKEHDSGRMHALQRRLREIPGDLHELFRDILTRDFHNRDELVLCIQWVLFSKQPLSPEQLYFAILSGVEPKALSRWDQNEIAGDIIKRSILNSSKGLTEITTSKTQKVQFIHESVKDFLLKENGLSNIWPDLGSNFQGQSHERLKNCCLNYMGIDVSTHLELSKSLPKASTQEAADLRKSATDAFPFLEYSVCNVLYHADAAAGGGIVQANFLQTFPLANWIKIDNLLEKHEVRRHTEGVSLLYVLAEGNMSNLIRVHPSILSFLKVENERYGLPLFASLATGSKEAVQTFLEAYAGKQPPRNRLHKLYSQYQQAEGRKGNFGRNFKFSNRRTVLSYLAELGDEIMFAFLLETGEVDVNRKDKDGRLPLSWAIEKGHEAIVKLLLETGKVNVDSRDKNGRTPLLWAVKKEREVIVKLLLDTSKVDVDWKDRDDRSPLSWATEKGHEAIVKLLLETSKVNVDSRDKNGRTPLSWAVEKGHEVIVKLLLDTGNWKDSDDRPLLSWATEKGHEAIVKLLLETGKVNIDSRDKNGQTPLLWAVKEGYEVIVKLLLDTGKVDVNCKDRDDRPPLLWATKTGHEAIVKLLLETGKVNVDSRDENGRTILSWAAEKGHKVIVKLLLDTSKVDINWKDRDDRSPLSWATEKGHEAIVMLLLETDKINVDSRDKNGQTPLLWAAEKGHKVIVKLLLDTGKVNVNWKDRDNQSPLSWAIEKGHEAIVKLLLEIDKARINWKDKNSQMLLFLAIERVPLLRKLERYQATVTLLLETGKVDVNSIDKNGQTPLLWAAKMRHEAIVKLLLKIGKVNVDLRDKNGQTPLLCAAKKGYKTIVKLLLETGKVAIDSKDKNGWTPLLWAERMMHQVQENHALHDYNMQLILLEQQNKKRLLKARQVQDIMTELDHISYEAIVKLLLDTGEVDVNWKDKDGRTLLSWAVEKGCNTIVKLLLDTGKVNVDWKDKDGRTPLSWVVGRMSLLRIDGMPLLPVTKKEYEAVVKLLLEKGARNPNHLIQL